MITYSVVREAAANSSIRRKVDADRSITNPPDTHTSALGPLQIAQCFEDGLEPATSVASVESRLPHDRRAVAAHLGQACKRLESAAAEAPDHSDSALDGLIAVLGNQERLPKADVQDERWTCPETCHPVDGTTDAVVVRREVDVDAGAAESREGRPGLRDSGGRRTDRRHASPGAPPRTGCSPRRPRLRSDGHGHRRG